MPFARAAFAALALIVGSAEAAGPDAVDFQINGTTLNVLWAGATLQAPSGYWKWSRLQGLNAAKLDGFSCVNGMNESEQVMMFLVTRQAVKPLDASEMDELVRGIRKSMPGDRWVMARPRYEPSDIPWAGSYRFRYELTSAGPTAYLYGYAARRATRGYLTQCITLSTQEPAEFVQLSRSLFVREAKKNPRSRVLVALVLVFAAIGVVQWLRSR